MIISENYSHFYSHPTEKSPRIAFCWDNNHTDPIEKEISEKLRLLSNEKFTIITEERLPEKPSSAFIHSIELLRSDKKNSTATSVHLLTIIVALREDLHLAKIKKSCSLQLYACLATEILSSLFEHECFITNLTKSDYKKFHSTNIDKNLKKWDFSFNDWTDLQENNIAEADLNIIQKSIRKALIEIFSELANKKLSDKEIFKSIENFCKNLFLRTDLYLADALFFILEKIAILIAFQEIEKVKKGSSHK